MSKNVNEDGKTRSKGRFNIFDALVVLVLIAALALVAIKFVIPKLTGSNETVTNVQDVYVLVRCPQKYEGVAWELNVGDPVYSLTQVNDDAYVYDYFYKPAEVTGYNDEGIYVKSEHPMTYDVFVTVKATIDTSGVMKIGSIQLGSGIQMTLMTKEVYIWGYIEVISVGDDSEIQDFLEYSGYDEYKDNKLGGNAKAEE